MSNNSLKEAQAILDPFTQSLGEHSARIEFCGSSWGFITFAINWRCFKGEVQFISKDDLIAKAHYVVEILKEMRR
jgi:hypothetical protein